MFLHFVKLFLLAFIGSIAPAVAINIEKRLLLLAGLGGALGYCVALAFNPYSLSFNIAQIFMGTVFVGLYSELMATYLKAPATVFCIPGIFPFVPGVSAYQTVLSLANNEFNQAAVYGLNTVFKSFNCIWNNDSNGLFQVCTQAKQKRGKPPLKFQIIL